MASTELRKRGTNIKRLNDKQVRFVLEYLIDYNGTRAALAAGYSKVRASTTACDLLLKNPKVKALVGKLRREQGERFQIKADDVLKHLASGATRSGKGFVNDKGTIHTNLNDLPDEITDAINGIKQKRRTWTNAEGEEVVEIETELKLMPKEACLRMCMEHKGLFAAVESKVTMGIDFDALLDEEEGDDDILEVEIEKIK